MRVPTIREFFLYFLVFLLTIIIGCQHSQKKQLQETMLVLGDSLKQTTNKFGELQSSRTVIQGSVSMLQKLVESKDSTIAMLSKKVTRKTIATGVVIQSITDTIEIPGDTVYVPCDTVDRTFQLQDDWGRYRIDLRGNRALLAYDIKNSTSVDLSWQKQGFFKPALPVITVTDHNPHSRTKETQFMMVNKKPPGKKALRLIEKVGFFAGGYLLGRL
jgi:hypothetical protein